jgi:hypothetical protein
MSNISNFTSFLSMFYLTQKSNFCIIYFTRS